MNSVTVNFTDGSSEEFAAPTITLSDGQYWLEIKNGDGNTVALIPREMIKFVSTPFNTAP